MGPFWSVATFERIPESERQDAILSASEGTIAGEFNFIMLTHGIGETEYDQFRWASQFSDVL